MYTVSFVPPVARGLKIEAENGRGLFSFSGPFHSLPLFLGSPWAVAVPIPGSFCWNIAPLIRHFPGRLVYRSAWSLCSYRGVTSPCNRCFHPIFLTRLRLPVSYPLTYPPSSNSPPPPPAGIRFPAAIPQSLLSPYFSLSFPFLPPLRRPFQDNRRHLSLGGGLYRSYTRRCKATYDLLTVHQRPGSVAGSGKGVDFSSQSWLHPG